MSGLALKTPLRFAPTGMRSRPLLMSNDACSAYSWVSIPSPHATDAFFTNKSRKQLRSSARILIFQLIEYILSSFALYHHHYTETAPYPLAAICLVDPSVRLSSGRICGSHRRGPLGLDKIQQHQRKVKGLDFVTSSALVNSAPLSVRIIRIGKGAALTSRSRKSFALTELCSAYISRYVQRVHSSFAVN